MRRWVNELVPNERKIYSKHSSMVKFTSEQKKEAVIEFSTGDSFTVAVANTLWVSRISLYRWEKKLIGESHTTYHERGSAFGYTKKKACLLLLSRRNQPSRRKSRCAVLPCGGAQQEMEYANTKLRNNHRATVHLF